jgi:hypothetical protein
MSSTVVTERDEPPWLLLYPAFDQVRFPGQIVPLSRDTLDALLVATMDAHRAVEPAAAAERVCVVICSLTRSQVIGALETPSQLNGTLGVTAFFDADEWREGACSAQVRTRVRIVDTERWVPEEPAAGLFRVRVREVRDGPHSLRSMPAWPAVGIARSALVYCDPDRLADVLRATLKAVFAPHKLVLPRGATELSCWLAVHLPLSRAKRLELLEMHTIARLRALAEHVKALGDLVCSECDTVVGTVVNLIPSDDGALGSSYVNPHGFSHDLMALTELAIQPHLQGQPDPRNSWFDGYAWTIANCPTCFSHLGWKFTRWQSTSLASLLSRVVRRNAPPPADDNSRQQFWALTHRAVHLKSAKQYDMV